MKISNPEEDNMESEHKTFIREALIVLVITLFVFCWGTASAQREDDKTFPVGIPVEAEALFCINLEAAKAIADSKGESTPAIGRALRLGVCMPLQGVAEYVREVYRNGDWAVWELKSDRTPRFYEATDWKPREVK